MKTQLGSAIWSVVHEERRALVQDLETLCPPDWQTPSLCHDWDVHDVLAHLVDSAKTTRLRFIRGMLAARFDFNRDNAVGVRRERAGDPCRTLAEFRAVLTRTSSPLAALPTRLVEAFVHGEDIRQPLGINRDYPPASVATALDYQVNTSIKMGGGKELAQGWHLAACDTAFEHGEGPEVRGPAIALLFAVSGRPVSTDEFTGSGAVDFAQHAHPPYTRPEAAGLTRRGNRDDSPRRDRTIERRRVPGDRHRR